MRFETIKNFVDSRLQRGLGQQDVKDLVQLVAGGDRKFNKVEAQQLAKVAMLYADQFTSAGVRTFEEMTGLDLQPAQALPRERRMTAVDLRAKLAREVRGTELSAGRGAGRYITNAAVGKLSKDAKALVEARLPGGLGKQDAKDIVDFVNNHYGNTDGYVREGMLAEIAEYHGAQFTSAGARAFAELSGISVDNSPVADPSTAGGYGSSSSDSAASAGGYGAPAAPPTSSGSTSSAGGYGGASVAPSVAPSSGPY